MTLDTLRALPLENLPDHSGQDEARLLRNWLVRCDLYVPELARDLQVPVARVCDRLMQKVAATGPCHRDLHEKQILIVDGVAGLLDFDTLSTADPALDPGNLLAHLFLTRQSEKPLKAQFEMPGLDIWRQASLLRLLMLGSFTSLPPSTAVRMLREVRAFDGGD